MTTERKKRGKLTKADLAQIKKFLAGGRWTVRAIAKKYDVTPANIYYHFPGGVRRYEVVKEAA